MLNESSTQPLLQKTVVIGEEDFAESLQHDHSRQTLEVVTTDVPMASVPLEEELLIWLEQLGLHPEQIADKNLLLSLIRMDTGFCSQCRWIALDHMINKVFQLFLLPRPYNNLDQRLCFTDRLFFPTGLGRPLHDKSSVTRMVMVGIFRHSTEFFLEKSLHLFIYGLVMYALIENKESIFREILNGSTGAIESMVHELSSVPKVVLGLIASSPLIYGLYRCALFYRRMQTSVEKMLYQRLQRNDSQFSRCWRWVLPMPPCITTGIQEWQLLPRLIIWDAHFAEMALEGRGIMLEKIINTMTQAALHEKWYTQLNATNALAHLVYGVSLGDLVLEKKLGLPGEIILSHVQLKQQALRTIRQVLQERAFPYRVHARYQLWKIGDYKTAGGWNIPIFLFKAGKLYLLVHFYKLLIETIIDAIRCPDKPGFQFGAGYAKWSSDYSQACFDELVKQFNFFPGQPASTLVDQIYKYHIQSPYLLDLSNKGVNASVVSKIIQGFYENEIVVNEIDLSGNLLNTPDDMSTLLPSLTGVLKLDLSNNNLGYLNTETINAFAENAIYLSRLSSLDLSNNNLFNIGNSSAFAENLTMLEKLEFLDVSINSIEAFNTDSTEVTMALANSLKSLTLLTYLNLGDICLGCSSSEEGVIAIGESLCYLSNLSSLDLSSNPLAGYYQNGTIASITNCLTNLTKLNYLSMYGSDIGQHAIQNDIVNFLDSLLILTRLKYLSLGNNYINPTQDTHFWGGLGNLSCLTLLSLSGNGIGSNSSVTSSVASSLVSLENLTTLDISNTALNSADENAIFFLINQLPRLTSLISLNISLNDLDRNSTLLLFNRTSLFNNLESFFSDLSYNYDDNVDFLYQLMKTIPHLPNLKHFGVINANFANFQMPITLMQEFNILLANDTQICQYQGCWQGIAIANDDANSMNILMDYYDNSTLILDLSYMQIHGGSNYSLAAVATLSTRLTYFNSLTSLNLNGVFLNSMVNGTLIALSEALSQSKTLIWLDLSWNAFYSYNDEMYAVGHMLSGLTGLSVFIFSNNCEWSLTPIDISFISNISEELIDLDLSNNNIQTEGIFTIAEKLGSLKNLISLDLSNNNMSDSNATVALGGSLASLTKLTALYLADCYIGTMDSRGVISIAESLLFLTSLKYIDLGGNAIGSTDAVGPTMLLSVLPTLTQLQFINIAGVQSATWTQAANALVNINREHLQGVCEIELCFGSANQTNTTENHYFESANTSYWVTTQDMHPPCVFPGGRTNLLHTGGDTPSNSLLPLCLHAEPPSLSGVLLPLFARSMGMGFVMGMRDKARHAFYSSANAAIFEWGITALMITLMTEGNIPLSIGCLGMLLFANRLGMPLQVANSMLSLTFSLYAFKKIYDIVDAFSPITLAIIPLQHAANRVGYYVGNKALFWVNDVKKFKVTETVAEEVAGLGLRRKL